MINFNLEELSYTNPDAYGIYQKGKESIQGLLDEERKDKLRIVGEYNDFKESNFETMRIVGRTLESIISERDSINVKLETLRLSTKNIINAMSQSCIQLSKENETLKEQLKCKHSWVGKSENQYCSKCGLN